MEWIINKGDGTPAFKVVPYSNHLCYQLFQWDSTLKRDTGEESWGWKDTGKYPSNLPHACEIIRNMMVMEWDIKTSDFKEIKKAITQSTNAIIAATKDMTA